MVSSCPLRSLPAAGGQAHRTKAHVTALPSSRLAACWSGPQGRDLAIRGRDPNTAEPLDFIQKAMGSHGKRHSQAGALGERGPNVSGRPPEPVKHRSLGPPQSPMQWVWVGRWGRELTDSLVTLQLVVRGPHFENCRFRALWRGGWQKHPKIYEKKGCHVWGTKNVPHGSLNPHSSQMRLRKETTCRAHAAGRGRGGSSILGTWATEGPSHRPTSEVKPAMGPGRTKLDALSLVSCSDQLPSQRVYGSGGQTLGVPGPGPPPVPRWVGSCSTSALTPCHGSRATSFYWAGFY